MTPCQHGPKHMINICPDCRDLEDAYYRSRISKLHKKLRFKNALIKKLVNLKDRPRDEKSK